MAAFTPYAFWLGRSLDDLEVQGSRSHPCDECGAEQQPWEVCLSVQEERAMSLIAVACN